MPEVHQNVADEQGSLILEHHQVYRSVRTTQL